MKEQQPNINALMTKSGLERLLHTPFVKELHNITGIHGILGIHVDDGLGGGDEVFAQAIDQLEKRFLFGSKRTILHTS